MEAAMEKIVHRDNMNLAYLKIRQNKGSYGVDKMTIEETEKYLKTNWYEIKDKLIDGTYKPKAVRKVEIPKENGGIRTLGIPTVIDRIIQQAIVQIKYYVPKNKINKLKNKLRKLLRKNWSIKMETRIKKINQLITGWVQYYKYANMKNHMEKIDSWVRRKLRAIKWKEWKTPKNRRKNLIKLGMDRKEAYIYSNTRKAYWRISKSWILNKTLTNQYWISQGFKSFSNYYNAVKIQS